MTDYVDGNEYSFSGFTVTGDYHRKDGTLVRNPHVFKFPVEGQRKHESGLSIRVKKVVGFAQKNFLEVSFYNDAFSEAKALKLKHGEKIDFFGLFSVEKGFKRDFEKVSINDALQIRRFTGREAKASEI